MLLNPIPWNSTDSEVYLLRYMLFSIIAILAAIFIVGTILTLKYNKHRKLMGKIFVVIGTIELIPYTIAAIQIIMLNLLYQLYNPYLFLFTLGCITLTGGVANIKQAKHPLVILPNILSLHNDIMDFLWFLHYALLKAERHTT